MTAQLGSAAWPSSIGLGAFIRERRPNILAAWERAVRALPIARDLERLALLDHIPDLLDRVADMASELEAGGAPRLPRSVAELHAIERLDEGFDLAQVVTEFSILRDCITRLWEEHVAEPTQLIALRVLNQAIDKAVSASVDRYTFVRDQTLQAIDRLANAALDSRDLDDMLRRLLAVLMETTPAVDTAEILLREGEMFRARAAVGLDADVEQRFAVAMGEGFAGTIAADGKPREVRSGSTDPTVISPALRGSSVRALYGVPLVDDGRVIGVAHIGSKTAHEFSIQDKRMFTAMANRATSAILQHWLRETAERSSAQLGFLAEASNVLASSLDYVETMEKVANLTIAGLAEWCVVDIVEGPGVRRVAIAHRDPSKVELAREWARKYPPDMTAQHGVPRVIRTGVAEVVSDVTDDVLTRAAHDSAHLELLRGLGLCSYVVAPLTARGRTLGALTLMSTSPRRRYDQGDVELVMELARRAAVAVDNALLHEAAHEAVRLREKILAIVSHDLRNPLSAIDLSATLLYERRDADPKSRPPLEVIRRSTDRMEKMIRDLLDMASIQAGRLAIAVAPADAGELLSDLASTHAGILEEHGLTLRQTQHERIVVACDRDRICQVLGNLLGNAIKFSESGDCISISVTRDGDRARFVVADVGPGIAPEHAAHIFEPYWSAPQHAKKGTGLGLYIAKGIVEAHGGRLWVESDADGTVFSFTLPVVPDDRV